MKTISKILAGAIFAGFIGTAQAVPVTLTDPITLSHNLTVNSTAANFSYNLADYGFDASLHSLESAILSLTFTVTGNNANQIGQANDSIVTIALAGQSNFTGSVASFNDLVSPALLPISADALTFASGVLNFSLTRSPNAGGVVLSQTTLWVTASTLNPGDPGDNGNGNPPPPLQSVPEPGTLALIGLGLLGGVLVRRRTTA